VAPNSEQEMSTNAPRPGRTPTSPHSERAAGGRAHQWWHPERIAEERKVHLLSSIRSASPLFAVRKCSQIRASLYKSMGPDEHEQEAREQGKNSLLALLYSDA